MHPQLLQQNAQWIGTYDKYLFLRVNNYFDVYTIHKRMITEKSSREVDNYRENFPKLRSMVLVQHIQRRRLSLSPS